MFIVRDYTVDDYDKVQSVWTDTDLGGDERGDNRSTIEESIKMGGRLLLLEDSSSNIITGTSWMTFDGRRIHLHHFGILTRYQGKGLSKILLKSSFEHILNRGCQVKLEVHKSNIKALNLYKKYGFEYLGDYDVYIIRDMNLKRMLNINFNSE